MIPSSISLKQRDFISCQKYLSDHIVRDCLTGLNSAGKPFSSLINDSKIVVNLKEELLMFLANMEVYGSTSEDINFLDHVQQRMLS